MKILTQMGEHSYKLTELSVKEIKYYVWQPFSEQIFELCGLVNVFISEFSLHTVLEAFYP